MEALVRHLVEPLVSHPDDVQVHTVDSDAVTILEMAVHDDDRDLFEDDDGRTLRSIRTILSAAAGKRKATLDLMRADEFGAEE